MDNKTFYVASFCAAVSLPLIWKWRRVGAKLQFPPGPKGLPLLGNLFDIPRDVPMWQAFTSITRKYDTDVLYLRLMTTNVVILSSFEAISDLPEKRSNIYSDRPWIPMLDLMGQYTWAIPMMPYGKLWRDGRKLLHEFLNPNVVTEYDECQSRHAHSLLLRLSESPEHFLDHVELSIAALVMEVTYGLEITSNQDRFLRAAIEAVDITTRAMVPGAFLVDIIPILKYVPEWVPGAGFKTFARVARKKFDLAVDGPLEYVKRLMESGANGNRSIAWTCFDRERETGDRTFDESVIRSATATVYIAAAEATVSILQTFFLAMALNPHVVRKAQEELDRVIGGDRLPDFSDEENLPYVSAVLKEVFRWGCPFPIGVPKRLIQDDTYRNYFIPAGTIVVENVWALFYDESANPAPHTYDPERFLKDGKLDPSIEGPEEKVFGTGRRACPGRYLAMRTLFIDIACILTVFDIMAPEDGNLEAKFNEEHLVRKSAPFKCTIRPRSEASLRLMRSARHASDG